MKTKINSILAAAGLIFLASCGGGVSEETKKSVAALDSSMNALMASANTLVTDITSACDMCKSMCASADSVSGTVKAEWKGKADSAAMDCKASMAEFENIMNTAKAAAEGWASDTTWASFKNAVEKGTIKDAEAKKELENWMAKYNDANTKVTEWTTAYNSAKEKCMKGKEAWKNFMAWVGTQDTKKKK
jgi:hypothetical protein